MRIENMLIWPSRITARCAGRSTRRHERNQAIGGEQQYQQNDDRLDQPDDVGARTIPMNLQDVPGFKNRGCWC